MLDIGQTCRHYSLTPSNIQSRLCESGHKNIGTVFNKLMIRSRENEPSDITCTQTSPSNAIKKSTNTEIRGPLK